MNSTDEEQETPTDDGEPTKNRREKLFAVLPTMLTLGNAVCGFGSITIAAKVGLTAEYGNELWIAGGLIYIAMIFDMFDGTAARLLNQTSEFGALMDSLCDAISFGVAPAFLMLQFTFHTHAGEAMLDLSSSPTYPQKITWAIGAAFMVCAILRLARFTVETDEDDSHEFFSGLPSPAAAGVVASFPIVMDGLIELANADSGAGKQIAQTLVPVVKLVLPLATFAAACLMISKIRYPHFFNQLFRDRASRKHVILMLVALALLFFMHQAFLFVAFTYFAFFAPIRSLVVNRVLPLFAKTTGDSDTETG